MISCAFSSAFDMAPFSNFYQDDIYRDEINSLQIQLRRTQAGPGRAVKEQQEQNSPNHVQRINFISVLCGSEDPNEGGIFVGRIKFSCSR